MPARKEWETVADVFISYHHDSAEKLVEQIAAALEKAGISCWYAKRDIPPGGDFARYIPLQINACKVFLLILSSGVCESRHVQNSVPLRNFHRINNRSPGFVRGSVHFYGNVSRLRTVCRIAYAYISLSLSRC